VAVILPSGTAQSAAAAQESRAGDLQLRALAAHELRTVRRIRAGSSGSGPRCGPPGRRETRPGRRQPAAVILPSGTAQSAAAAQEGRAGDLQQTGELEGHHPSKVPVSVHRRCLPRLRHIKRFFLTNKQTKPAPQRTLFVSLF